MQYYINIYQKKYSAPFWPFFDWPICQRALFTSNKWILSFNGFVGKKEEQDAIFY
jgi:hypothetical protein